VLLLTAPPTRAAGQGAREVSRVLAEALEKLEAKGYRAAAVPVERLAELRAQYEDLARRRVLDERIADDLLRGLTFEPPDAVRSPASLVVVATADPMVCCTFRWRGADVPVPVPPTYLHLRRKSEEATRAVADVLPEQSHATCIINAPHKALAVRSGLARYGRNNITYIPGLGSFYRLTTVCTDIPCDVGEWVDPAMMTRCDGCARCADACPTGAIPRDRVVLRAERCITYWNEKPVDVPFPEWIENGWHDCLVGCLHCQRACPENEAVLGYREDGPQFTEHETRALLAASGPQDLSGDLRRKLENWDLLDWLGVLPRNLAVHLRGC
jgi:epoxyqueuosine reductase